MYGFWSRSKFNIQKGSPMMKTNKIYIYIFYVHLLKIRNYFKLVFDNLLSRLVEFAENVYFNQKL